MDKNHQRKIAELINKSEITDVVNSYFRALDEKKFDPQHFNTFFVKDATVNPETNLPVMILVSRKDLDGEGKEHGFGQGVMFQSEGKGEGGPSFGASDGARDVKFMMDKDGKSTLEINGKKYKVPEDLQVSIHDTPPSITTQGDDVYINGTKVEPEE